MKANYDFVSHVVNFCTSLREHGLSIGPQETSDSIRAVNKIRVLTECRIYWTLRAVLVSRQEHLKAFDSLFPRFWHFQPLPRISNSESAPTNLGETRATGRTPRVLALPDHAPDSKDTLVQLLRTGASRQHVKSELDLNALDSKNNPELSRIAARLVRALAFKPSRRLKRHRRKGVLNLRSVMRLSLATGGVPIHVPRMRRTRKLPKLLVALDVSGSMDHHARLLLQLMFSVGKFTNRIEVFVFSTTITRVTKEIAAPTFHEALIRIGRSVNHWSGGTRIGESLAHLCTKYEKFLDRHTTMFVLSDGWETGEPDDLARSLQGLKRRVNAILWLNPLLSTAGFEPLARGLQAATPYVDHFAPAADVEHLRQLPELLRR